VFGSLSIKIGLQKGFYNKKLLTPGVFNEYYRPYKKPDARQRTLDLLRLFNREVPLLAARLSEITHPTLILWAEYERFFSYQAATRLQKDIPDAQLETITGCGHFIQEEQPQNSLKVIESFLMKGKIEKAR
jgi:pimeloyl-ACP methyl ester carboxylesterase